jgi:glycosyltransferase involved in cell wall biosynthesis
MKILHLLSELNIGGIEMLCKDYVQCSEHENIVLTLYESEALLADIKMAGVDTIELQASKKNILRTVYKVLQVCKKRKPDVVVAQHSAPIIHLCLMGIKKFNPDVITVAYAHANLKDTLYTRGKDWWLQRFIIMQSFKKADKVIAISNSVKNSLIHYINIPERKITVLYNGVKIEAFEYQKTVLSHKIRLIYVGRLIEAKGVQNILCALSKIDTIDYQMWIVGDGAYKKALETISMELNLQDKIEFLGSRRDISELLQESDIFVHMPNWEEGFGITVVEAMAAGKICIVANSGAMPEMITDGINGFIVEKGNIQALAEKIGEVADQINTEEMQKIRENAVKRAKDFAIEKYTKQLDDIVQTK